jgi:hypothetical protein
VKNVINLTARVEEMLNALRSNVKMVPPEVGFACSELARQVDAVLPNARYNAVGGFFMLRFVCPALASPETFNLRFSNPERRRGLVLVSKVLICISSGIELGKKEPFMAQVEPLVESSTDKMHQFYDDVVETFGEEAGLELEPFPDSQVDVKVR